MGPAPRQGGIVVGTDADLALRWLREGVAPRAEPGTGCSLAGTPYDLIAPQGILAQGSDAAPPAGG